MVSFGASFQNIKTDKDLRIITLAYFLRTGVLFFFDPVSLIVNPCQESVSKIKPRCCPMQLAEINSFLSNPKVDEQVDIDSWLWISLM